jgi:hypothetical protein
VPIVGASGEIGTADFLQLGKLANLQALWLLRACFEADILTIESVVDRQHKDRTDN